MATAPERSNPLHNFSLPYLQWGSQRFLKCMKVSPNTNSSPLDRPSTNRQSKSYQFRARPMNSRATNSAKISSPKNPSHYSKQKPIYADNDRAAGSSIERMRGKIILDIREESKKLKFTLPDEGVEDDSAAARPWNLRTRRAACKAPQEDRKVEFGSPSMKVLTKKENEKEKERTMLSVSLSKEEVEEDFAAMVGSRPPRRPKKRPRVLQKQLDTLFPGLWLTEVTLDSYRVADDHEA